MGKFTFLIKTHRVKINIINSSQEISQYFHKGVPLGIARFSKVREAVLYSPEDGVIHRKFGT